MWEYYPLALVLVKDLNGLWLYAVLIVIVSCFALLCKNLKPIHKNRMNDIPQNFIQTNGSYL